MNADQKAETRTAMREFKGDDRRHFICLCLDCTQPAQPVAWVDNLGRPQPHCVTDLKFCSMTKHRMGEHLRYIPLYLHPAPAQTPLTPEVIRDMCGHFPDAYFHLNSCITFARAIERAHGIPKV